jgi:hypothetical protein
VRSGQKDASQARVRRESRENISRTHLNLKRTWTKRWAAGWLEQNAQGPERHKSERLRSQAGYLAKEFGLGIPVEMGSHYGE